MKKVLSPEHFEESFDDWFSEQCSIEAAELVGPNSLEYERLTERFYDDEDKRAVYYVRHASLK